MFTAAYRVLGDGHMASEAVQQAFVQAWQAALSFDPNRELLPWLCAITRRTAVDVFRRERRRRENWAWDESLADITAAAPSMESIWEAWQVRAALQHLPKDEREILQMAYFLGMSQSDISRTAGIALGTVKSRTARAQRRLAALLSHLAQDAESVA